ncbi:hypothetical protein BLNAU_20956 [Blattamonas nauphoetae]|uniref:Uncharacterized protein n=1 Tax=Blattamonas nauphoetae TaxID=2049346 RepID=A0ABQ9WYB7_9EUKA|nr:hypothetical protein BLNAU_20956 [Blattamonas nauphoetae]
MSALASHHVSLDRRYTLLLLRCHSRTAQKWKLPSLPVVPAHLSSFFELRPLQALTCSLPLKKMELTRHAEEERIQKDREEVQLRAMKMMDKSEEYSSQTITTAAMKMLKTLIFFCSLKIRLALFKADLIPQLITTLNPLSLPFDNTVDIHNNLMITIFYFLWLSTPNGLARLKIDDPNEQQAVHETVLKQVLIPSERYICYLCVNRFSIIDGEQSKLFLSLLVHLLRICPYYQPTMDFLLNMPIFVTIPSCLTFFEKDRSNWGCLYFMIDTQREWNRAREEVRQMGKKVHIILRMEGMDDSIEETLQNEKNKFGARIVAYSIKWNNLLGMNLPN